MMSSSSPGPRIENLTVQVIHTGLYMVDCIHVQFRDLEVTSDRNGLSAYNTHVQGFNSSLVGSTKDIKLYGASWVTLTNCEHGYKVERSEKGHVIARRMVDITNVSWSDGPPVLEGNTRLLSSNGTLMALLDNDGLGLTRIEYWFVTEGRRIHKTVHHYLMRALGGELSDSDVEVTEVAWVPLSELESKLVYADERKLAELAGQLIDRMDNEGHSSETDAGDADTGK